jgi:hypothetical protein
MKTTSLLALLAAVAVPQLALGQTSSSTPVIGYYKFDVPAGTSAWVCGFVTKKEFQGAAASMAAGANSTITQTGATFPAFPLHYVEILSGPQAGLVLDIVSNTATTIVVEGNSTSLGLTGTETYCVRKHATVNTVFANVGTFEEFQDSVTVYADTGIPKSFFRANGAWVGDDFTTPAGDSIIYPGQGFVIDSSAVNVLTFGGNEVAYVKSGPTKVPVYRGVLNFVGVVNPLVATQAADPIFSLTSTTSAAGAQSNLRASGYAASGLEDFVDSISTFTQGGAFNVLRTQYTNASDLVNDDFTTVDNTSTARNGAAVAVAVDGAADRVLTLQQNHPN